MYYLYVLVTFVCTGCICFLYLLYILVVRTIYMYYILEKNKNFYKNSEDVGMAQKAHKQERDVTQ